MNATIEDISKAMILVSMEKGLWGARKTDKAVSAEVTEEKGIRKDAGSWNKKLLPKVKAFKDVTNAMQRAYVDHVAMTLPWTGSDRALPVAKQPEWEACMAKHAMEIRKAIDEFIDVLPDLIENSAKPFLGPTFRAEDYNVEKIKQKFYFAYNEKPFALPSDFARVPGLDQGAVNRYESALQGAVKEATGSLWTNLLGQISKIASTMADEGKIFKKNIFENLDEFLSNLPSYNIFDDQDLATFADEARALLGYDPDSLRQDKKDALRNEENLMRRATLAEDAEKLQKAMAPFVAQFNLDEEDED